MVSTFLFALLLIAAQDNLEDSFFPERPGTTWTYDGTYRYRDGLKRKVLKPIRIQGRLYRTVEWDWGHRKEIRCYRIKDRSLYWVANVVDPKQKTHRLFDKPVLIVTLPKDLKTNAVVATPLGKLKCILVKYGEGKAGCRYYAKGYGLVKVVSAGGTRSESTMTLKTFQPGK